jgi:MYXO-CTERM domain-containing protein
VGPDITFSQTGNYDGNVVNPVDQINSIIWQPKWVELGLDATTIAATTNTYTSDTGLTVDADMQFNGEQFTWRVGGTGCVSGDPNCYDIETVALHEIGHFIGLNHVSCTGSVMYPSASGQPTNYGQLSENEIAGICNLYKHNPSSTARAFGELCALTSDCDNLTCLKPAGGTASGENGWCTSPCTNSNDCPIAFVCEAVNTQGPMCVPGIHLPNLPTEEVVAADDLCQPCGDGGSCSTNTCVQDANGNGICMQLCSQDGTYACPENFACITTQTTTGGTLNVCYPVDVNVCQNTWLGVKLNDVCYDPGTAADPNSAFNLPCEAGLQCVLFPSTGYGSCLQGCDAITAGAQCPGGSECCYGFDPNTFECLNSSAGNGAGGCIELQSTGDDCSTPSQSQCISGATCFYINNPTTAQCFDLCQADGTCPSGEKCLVTATDDQGDVAGVCCDSRYYNGDPNKCFPKAGVCKRGTDVVCTQASDCASGTCQNYNSESFCTIPCVLNSDCPSTYEDVNGDGKPDGGGTCVAIGTSKVCVPNTGPAAAPACANTGSGSSGGCGCQGTGPADMLWLAALGLVLILRIRRTY